MERILISLLTLVAALGSVQAAETSAQPIVELKFVRADVATSRDTDVPAELQVFADGTVVARCPDRTAQAKMPPEHVRALLRELLQDCRLNQIDSNKLRADVQAEGIRLGLSSQIAGAEDTLIQIRWQERSYELRCHATGLMASRFPEVAGLQSMLKAQERLGNIRALVLLGNGRQATALAERATESLVAQMPGAQPLTPRELSMVHVLPDGTRLVQFCRRADAAAQVESPLIIVSVMETPGEQVRVTVLSGESIVQ